MPAIPRALIVDDSRVIRAITRKSLQDMGFEITEASDGASAIQHMQEAPPALVLIDWHMPGLSGVELVRTIRDNPQWAEVRLIMLTSEDHIDRVKEALAAGVDEYLVKPFTRDTLQDKLSVLGIRIPNPFIRL